MQDSRRFGAKAVVVATGTFLNGTIHTGRQTFSAGRAGEPASIELAESLKQLWFSGRPAKNRDAAAARRADDRLGCFRAAAAGRKAGRVLVRNREDRTAADPVFYWIYEPAAASGRSAITCISRRFILARSRASGRDIARRSRTRSLSSPTRTATSFFSNLKAITPTRSI